MILLQPIKIKKEKISSIAQSKMKKMSLNSPKPEEQKKRYKEIGYWNSKKDKKRKGKKRKSKNRNYLKNKKRNSKKLKNKGRNNLRKSNNSKPNRKKNKPKNVKSSSKKKQNKNKDFKKKLKSGKDRSKKRKKKRRKIMLDNRFLLGLSRNKTVMNNRTLSKTKWMKKSLCILMTNILNNRNMKRYLILSKINLLPWINVEKNFSSIKWETRAPNLNLTM